MINKTTRIPLELLLTERLRGSRIMVYFRWLFIGLLVTLISIQLFTGYREESVHAILLVLVYAIFNVLIQYSLRKQYDQSWIHYLSAFVDIGIISFHLYYLSSSFDPYAVSAAATILLYPVMILLYTFRLDQRLMFFITLFAVVTFNLVYFSRFTENPGNFAASLSLTPTSHLFKSTYILFMGMLCLYLQRMLKTLLIKQMEEARKSTEAKMLLQMSEQKNQHAQELIENEKSMNRKLENEIEERVLTEKALQKVKIDLEKLNARLEQEVEERTAELTRARTQLLNLQKENLETQFEMLKQQVNPHFLFNSLNVLTSLIRLDPELAETFTERLAKVYRYVLENKDKDLVPVKTEMEFLKAYAFLLDTRFAGKVLITVDFDQEKEERFLLPLSLQLLIENAIKHNTFSRKNPLEIRLFIDEEGYLNVMNNLQSRETHFTSTGVGQQNIIHRYALVCDKKPVFEERDGHYLSRLPLISNY